MTRAQDPVPLPPAGWDGPGSTGACPTGESSPGWAAPWDERGGKAWAGQPWPGPQAPLPATFNPWAGYSAGTPYVHPGYAAPSYGQAAPGQATVPLSAEVARSDPRNPEHQAILLARIGALRASMPADAHDDLAANLDMASTLTQYLIRMGGLGPEDVLQIVSRLVADVEASSGEASRGRPRPVVLGTTEASEGNLRLIGTVDESRGRLLGEIMVQLGCCTREKLHQALKVHKATGVRLGEALVSSGAATWEQVKRAISVQNQIRKG